jgi:hypothetical protein
MSGLKHTPETIKKLESDLATACAFLIEIMQDTGVYGPEGEAIDEFLYKECRDAYLDKGGDLIRRIKP